jgi:hypothetical protein
MALQLTLPPELEARLRQEAERRGQPTEAVALRLLDEHLPPLNESNRRIQAAKSLEELFAAADAAPEQDDGYDLLQALDQNRQGERPLFPPELKGVSW